MERNNYGLSGKSYRQTDGRTDRRISSLNPRSLDQSVRGSLTFRKIIAQDFLHDVESGRYTTFIYVRLVINDHLYFTNNGRTKSTKQPK